MTQGAVVRNVPDTQDQASLKPPVSVMGIVVVNEAPFEERTAMLLVALADG